MIHLNVADREDEIKLFKAMLAGQSAERILLLQAPGGRGKSTLLKTFQRCCPPEITCAPVDLKGSAAGLREIFYELCDILGWDNFPRFDQAVDELVKISVGRNVMIGKPKIEIALHAEDQNSREARQSQLTRAFFEDLRALPRPPALIFDTFEAASPEVRRWFQKTFLPYAHRSPGLVTVVAGRGIPEESIAWDCRIYHLPPIDDPRHWHIYCQQINLNIPLDGIKALCAYIKGHPDEMNKALRAVAEAGVQL